MKFLIATVLLAASPTLAETSAVQPGGKPDAPKHAKDDANRKICRADARTSTRLVKRTCRTAAEWKMLDQQTDGANNIVRSQ